MLYNPFKPHIVRNGLGEYQVRKLNGIFGWQYASSSGSLWYSELRADSFTSIEQARSVKEVVIAHLQGLPDCKESKDKMKLKTFVE